MKKFLGILAVLVLLAVGGFMFANRQASEAYASDCDNNAIIFCGVKDQAALKAAYKDNTTKDLPQIFAHYKISASMINNATAKQGTVYKNGDIKIGNELVATGAQSVGRHNMTGSQAVTITLANGTKKTIYQRKTSVSFAANSIPALVFVDSNGKFVAAVLKSCGNPVIATPKPKPIYLCKSLAVNQVPATPNKLSFKADVVLNDVTFKYITYTVKNNGKVVGAPIKSETRDAYIYTATTPGEMDVEATVTVQSNGKMLTSPVGDCKAGFVVVSPEFKCTKLTIAPTTDRTKFTFTPTVSTKNGATFKSIVYKVQNASGATIFTSPAQTTQAYTYTQATPGNYKVITETNFEVLGKPYTTKDAACTGQFTVKEEPQTPVHVCKSLTIAQNGGRTNFVFTPAADISGGATFKSATYTVKNANGQVVKTINATNLNPVQHIQTGDGKYTVELVIDVTVNGQTKRATGNCVAEFEVTPEPATPKFECTRFTSTPVVGQKRTYNFSIVYVAEGGAQLTKASVNFGDSTTAQDIALDKLTGFTHTYAKDGSQTATATLTFKTGANSTEVKDVTCSTKVEVVSDKCPVPGKTDLEPDSPDCYVPCKYNGEIKESDAACKPCEDNPNLPANSPDCKKTEVLPATLVNTGPGEILGMFASITIAGAVAHRFVWMRRYQ